MVKKCFFIKYMAPDDFSEPSRRADPNNPILIFCRFWVWVTSEARGSVSVGFWGQLSPFWGGRSSQAALSTHLPSIESLSAPLANPKAHTASRTHCTAKAPGLRRWKTTPLPPRRGPPAVADRGDRKGGSASQVVFHSGPAGDGTPAGERDGGGFRVWDLGRNTMRKACERLDGVEVNRADGTWDTELRARKAV